MIEEAMIEQARKSDRALVKNLFTNRFYLCNTRKEMIKRMHEITGESGDARTLYIPKIWEAKK